MIPVVPQFYLRGDGGAPSNALALPQVERWSAYRHSITDAGGFESATLRATMDGEALAMWLDRLMSSVVVYGPDGDIVWEGFVSGVSADFGGESIALSLDALANAVTVRYRDDANVEQVTTAATSATSISTFGRRELVYRMNGRSATWATAIRDRLLAERSRPRATRRSSIGGQAPRLVADVTVSCAGWYSALDWLTTSSTTATTAIATTQVQNLITTYNSTNAFFSTNWRGVVGSGVSESQVIAPDTTYRKAIEDLLDSGNSSGQRYAWGVYEYRQFQAAPWAGATPSTITYVRDAGEQVIRNSSGWAIVAPWDVRPNAMYQAQSLLGANMRGSTTDQTVRYYVARVQFECDAAGRATVSLEPGQATSLDALIARVR
jgi:hypothetical protein